MATVVYLHGLASSPLSTKGTFFRKRFEARGIRVEMPDLNQDDFGTLTVSRALAQTLSQVDAVASKDGPVLLMGSSFGGLLSALAAAERPGGVRAAILMAPAFDMPGLWQRQMGPDGLAAWKRDGSVPVDHPAYPEVQRLGYGFYEDAVRVGTDPPKLDIPCVVFHGLFDDVVDPAVARRFGELNSQAEVHMLDDDHELLPSQAFMGEKVDAFLDGVLD